MQKLSDTDLFEVVHFKIFSGFLISNAVVNIF